MVTQESIARYPSIELAYEAALEAYGVAERRLISVENWLTQVAAFSAAWLIAPMAFLAAAVRPFPTQALSLLAPAVILFLLAAIVCLYARASGALTVPSPEKTTREWWSAERDTFYEAAIVQAGTHWRKNRDLVARKARVAAWGSAFLIVQIFFEALWLIVTFATTPTS